MYSIDLKNINIKYEINIYNKVFNAQIFKIYFRNTFLILKCIWVNFTLREEKKNLFWIYCKFDIEQKKKMNKKITDDPQGIPFLP